MFIHAHMHLYVCTYIYSLMHIYHILIVSYIQRIDVPHLAKEEVLVRSDDQNNYAGHQILHNLQAAQAGRHVQECGAIGVVHLSRVVFIDGLARKRSNPHAYGTKPHRNLISLGREACNIQQAWAATLCPKHHMLCCLPGEGRCCP